MTRKQILDFWIAVHGPLNPLRQEEFLAHSEIAYLMTRRAEDVKACIRKHKKLQEIVACLRNKRTPANPSPSRKRRASTQNSTQPATDSPPRTRTGRSRMRGEVWDRPAPYGTTDPRYK